MLASVIIERGIINVAVDIQHVSEHILVLNSALRQKRAWFRIRTIETNSGRQRSSAEDPLGNRSGLGELALFHVINQDLLEAHVRVQQQRNAQTGVKHTTSTVLHSGCSKQRNKRDSNHTLEDPVIRAMSCIRCRVFRRVVDSALDVGCKG